MIYFTADLHLFHENILKYQAFTRKYKDIEDMHWQIIKTWNQIVGINDEVYILGDISMGHHEKAFKFIKERLNGRKHLIRGNHDRWSKKEEKELFETVKDYKVLRYNHERIVMFHYPIEEWDRGHYGDIHLHGHCHSNLKRKLPNRFDIGWDVHHRPVPIDEVLSWREDKHVAHHGQVVAREEFMPR